MQGWLHDDEHLHVCQNGEEIAMGYTTNACVSCIHVFRCKVDYMMTNTFMYAHVTLNYNKVMRIIPKSYMVATIVEH